MYSFFYFTETVYSKQAVSAAQYPNLNFTNRAVNGICLVCKLWLQIFRQCFDFLENGGNLFFVMRACQNDMVLFGVSVSLHLIPTCCFCISQRGIYLLSNSVELCTEWSNHFLSVPQALHHGALCVLPFPLLPP